MEIKENTEGLYIYGIIPTYYAAEQFMKLDKIGVFNIPFKKVSAIVAKKNAIDYKQSGTQTLAKLLIDHQKTIESLMEMGFSTVIPMRLGTFANSTSEVIALLEKGYDLIISTIEKISNHIEIDVVSLWSDFGQVISEVASSPQVAEMKAKIESGPEGITQSDQLAIGYLVKKMLDEKKEEYSAKIVESLAPFCQSTKQHEVQNDQMVSNTAFLLNKSQSGAFENALDLLDENFHGKLNFKLVGPLPCYSFYTIEIKDILFEEVDAARKELGLDHSTSEKNIKQAYFDKVKLFHPDTNPDADSAMIFDRINKAFHTLTEYVNAVKPSSREEEFSLQTDAFKTNSFFLKIKE
jgi:hypothetical protein